MINYEDVGARMKARRLYLGLSLNRAARRIGCTPSTLKRWEDGDTKSIKTTRLKMIAEGLDTTPEALLGLTEQVLPVKGLEPVPMMRTVPILGEIAAGRPILADQNFDGAANIPAGIKCDFALRVKGDSMINARIFDGDLVFIEQTSDVESGEIAAVLLGNEVTLKRIYKYEGRIELRPENPVYRPVSIEGPDLLDVKIIGRPVAFVGTIR